MVKHVCSLLGLALLFMVVGCSAAAPLVASAPPTFSLPTLIPPTPIPSTPTSIPTAIPTPTFVPTNTPTRIATVLTTQVVAPTVAPSPTLPPTPQPSSTPAIPPGLYVTSLRVDPDPPLRGADLRFVPTFSNTTGNSQNYRWLVYIFRADTPNRSTGETTRTDTPIQVGTFATPSLGSWKLPLGGPCDFFIAQVGWFNSENKIVWFTTPTGQIFQKGFTVCPP